MKQFNQPLTDNEVHHYALMTKALQGAIPTAAAGFVDFLAQAIEDEAITPEQVCMAITETSSRVIRDEVEYDHLSAENGASFADEISRSAFHKRGENELDEALNELGRMFGIDLDD